MGLISLIVGGIMDARKAAQQNQAQKNNNIRHIVVDNKYAIDVPEFLEPMHLNEEASFQYGNKTLDITFFIIGESKEEFKQCCKECKDILPDNGQEALLSDFAAVAINNMFDMDDVEIDKCQTYINGLQALVVNVFQKRTFFKDAVYANCAFVEGKDTLYQVIIMSGGTSIKKLSSTLEPFIHTFKEL